MEIFEKILDWVIKNKEWMFSGIGITVLGVFFLSIKKTKRFLLNCINRIKMLPTYFKICSQKKKGTYDDSSFVSEHPFDGISIPVGKIFKKSWTIKNSGDVIWKNRTLQCTEFANDFFYPVKPVIKIPTTLPGQIITLEVEYYVTAEGNYSSKWKMYDNNCNLVYPNKTIGLGVNVIARKSKNSHSQKYVAKL